MAEPPDLENLARRYIALWQEQMTAMAADPEMAAAFGRMFHAADPAAGPAANPMAWMAGLHGTSCGAAGGTPDAGGLAIEATRAAFAAAKAAADATAGAAAGAASPAAAPDDGGAVLRRIDRRLAALEKRLAAMEAELARGGPKPRKGGRGRKA